MMNSLTHEKRKMEALKLHDSTWERIDVCSTNIIQFMEALETHRSKLSSDNWKTFVESDANLKEWKFYLFNDPYTRWGYVKPRGYSGDAVLMDFAYKHSSIMEFVQESSELGKHIYKHTSRAPQSMSAVSRTRVISDLIENRAKDKIRIASVASGHGRELDFLSASALSNIESFLAVDSDINSLTVLQSASLSVLNVSTIEKNIFRTKLNDFGSREFVYSLGLFDYLNNEAAVKVLENMCSCVSAGGTVVIANLHYQAANLGYCEAIMDWWMIPRSEDDLVLISKGIQNLNS